MADRDRLDVTALFSAAWADGRRVWQPLLLTDLAYKLLAFAVLTPLLGLAVRLGVSLSGESVLADQDILYFLIRPVGLTILVIIVALFLAIVALQQACMMTICVGATHDARVTVTSALRFSLAQVRSVLALTLRLTARCLLLAAPFLAGVGLIYLLLLTDYDINYYLNEQPPAFLSALGLAGVLVLGLAWVLIPRLIGWAVALPLVLFENVSPRQAMVESTQRIAGHRPTIAKVLVLWGAGSFLLSVLAPALVFAMGRAIGPIGRSRVGLVLGLMLAILTLWLLVNLLVSWLSASSFALLVVHLYERFGGAPDTSVEDSMTRATDGPSGRLLSLRKLLVTLVGFAAVAGGLGFFLLEGVRGNDDVLVIAHRGASAAAPENTMASVDEAIAQQTDFIEIDVQETVDGEVAVFHDSDFMKVAGNSRKIWDVTWDDLQQIDIGSWFDPAFADQRVPHLRDVLEHAKGKARVNIELKYYGHDENLEQRTIDLVEQLEMADDIVVMSLKYDAVRKMRALRPDWAVGLLSATAIGDLTNLEADFLAVNASLATRGFVRRAHQRDKDVYVWTINDPVQMFRMMNLGVDGIITDEPGLARSVLERRAELNSAERLLVGIAFFFGASAPDPPATESDA